MLFPFNLLGLSEKFFGGDHRQPPDKRKALSARLKRADLRR
jgi:hypothetical protein